MTAGSVETESIDALMGALADLEDQIKEELEASQVDLEDITTFTEPSERSSLEDIDFSGDVSLIQNELVMVIDNTARTVSKLEVAMGKEKSIKRSMIATTTSTAASVPPCPEQRS